MSKYTTQYGTIVDSGFQPLLTGLAAYPIYDETHRAELNQKIYDRYRFREIGFETAAMFTHYFLTLIREIAPYYNELYESAAKKYDFLTDADYTETENTETTSESSGNSSGTTSTNNTDTNHRTHAHSDTPQGSFNFDNAMGNNEYLSDADRDDESLQSNSTGSSHGQSSATGSGESHRGRHVVGKFPGRSYSDLLKEYRETILNIDRMFLDELNVCFMGVY